MSEPSLEGFKYWLGRDVVDDAVSSEANVEIRRDGAREDVPAGVVGGSIGSY